VIKELARTLDLLQKVAQDMNAEQLMKSEITKGRNSLFRLEKTMQDLIKVLERNEHAVLNNDDIVIRLMVDLNREIGDIAQYVEEIHNCMILSAHRYADYMDNK
jgi:hypothetical protein